MLRVNARSSPMGGNGTRTTDSDGSQRKLKETTRIAGKKNDALPAKTIDDHPETARPATGQSRRTSST